VPDVVLPLSPLTPKDREDLRFGLDLGVDWVAMSFVQRPEDVAELRKLIGGRAKVLAKLEKPAAIERLEEIIDLSDAVMVARGDLGVEMPPEDVPAIQKRIVAAGRKPASRWWSRPRCWNRWCIRRRRPRPKRPTSRPRSMTAPMRDAVGGNRLRPVSVEAVAMMNRIIERMERDPPIARSSTRGIPTRKPTGHDAISAAAAQVAHTLSVAAIVTYSTSGSTVLRVARERPEVPILALTASLSTARGPVARLGRALRSDRRPEAVSEMVEKACRIALGQEMAKVGERLVITAGVPFGTPGSTNILRVAWVEE
jgi:pyruvate kinase